MYALIQDIGKSDTKLNEMRCHALRKMWTTIPSADAHFAGPVTSKMDTGFWDNHMYTFIAFNYFCYKCIPGTDLSGVFLSWLSISCFYFLSILSPIAFLESPSSNLFTTVHRIRENEMFSDLADFKEAKNMPLIMISWPCCQ